MADLLRRIGVWDGVAANAGTRLGFIGEWVEAEDEREINAAATTTISVPYEAQQDQSGSDLITSERVLRFTFADGDWFERRIHTIERQRESDGQRSFEVVADGMMRDLGSDMVTFSPQADDQVHHHFERYQLTPTEHINTFILPHAPSWFSLGTVESSDPVDMVYDWMTPLSALQELAKQATGPNTGEPLELRVRRNGTTDYQIDLLEEIGASADTPRIRVQRNLREASTEEDHRDAATRVYPRGAQGNSEIRPDMGSAEWAVSSWSGPDANDEVTITFEEDPIWDSHDLVGDYLRVIWFETNEDDTTEEFAVVVPAVYRDTVEILDASHPDQVTVDWSGLVAPDDIYRGQFVLDANARERTFLEDAGIEASNPKRAMIVDRQDVPTVINRVENPFMQDWTSGVPDHHAAVGGASISEETDSRYWKTAGRGARVQASAAGDGIRTDAVPVYPTPERQNYACQARLWVVSGTVRLRMVANFAWGDRSYPEGSTAATNVVGAWQEVLGVSPGKVNFNDVDGQTAQSFQLVAEAHGGSAEWILDAWQLMPSAGKAPTYVDGGYARKLWKAGQRALKRETSPRKRHDVRLADLGRLKPSEYPADQINVGAQMIVEDPDAGISIQERIGRVTRNLDVEGETEVELERTAGLDRDPSSLTGSVAQTERPTRENVAGGAGEEDGPPVVITSNDPGEGSTDRPDGTFIAVY